MNYFYDWLSCDLQQHIIKIAEKEYIKSIYKPWCVYKYTFKYSIEEYRYIECFDKIWYFDSIIESPSLENGGGGIGFLKYSEDSESKRIHVVYKSLNVIDEILQIKNCKKFKIQRFLNASIDLLDCHIYTGNVWSEEYKSPIDDHLELANICYDEKIPI